jgi:hypothetical protein
MSVLPHHLLPQLRQLKLAAIQEGSSIYVLKAELERAKVSLASMESTRDSIQNDSSERYIFSTGFVACLCSFNFHRCRQEQRRALQKLEQRASDLETQLSDALVDVQRRDATISELKAALQVCVPVCSLGRMISLHFIAFKF